jgi:hypothetical protein
MKEYLLEALTLKENHTIAAPDMPAGKQVADFTKRERETIYAGLKACVSPLRVQLRTIAALMENPKYARFQEPLTHLYEKIEKEFIDLCNEVITKLMKFTLGRRGSSTESEVFFHKMVGDYYRFLFEFTPPSQKKEIDKIKKEGKRFYAKAIDLAIKGHGFKKPLHKLNATYLSCVLHSCNFYF